MAEARVGIRLGVDGAEASSKSIEQFGQRGASALDRLKVSAERAGTGANYVEGNIKKLNRGVNDAVGSMQLLSTVIPGLGGSFGGLARTIGNVADVFGTLSSVLLRNPLGLAAIAATGAFVAYKAFSGAATDTAETTKRFTDAIVAAEQAIAKLRDGTDPSVTALSNLKKELDDQQQKIAPLAAAWKLYGEVQAEVTGKVQLTAEQQAKVDEAFKQSARSGARVQAEFERLNKQQLDVKLRSIAGEVIRMGGSMDKAAAEIARAERAMAQLQAQIDRTNVNKVTEQLEDFALGDKGRVERDFKARQDAINKTFDENAPGEFSRVSRLNREKRDADLKALKPKRKTEVDQLPEQYARLAASLDPVIARERELIDANRVLDEAQQRLGISTETITDLKQKLADKAYAATEAGKADAAAVAEAERLYASSITPMEAYERQLLAISRALELNKISEEQASRARVQAKTQMEQANKEGEGSKKTARELGLAFSSAFEDAVTGGKKLRDMITGLGQDLLRVFIRRQLTEPLLELFDTVLGKGSGSKDGGLFGGLFGGIGSAIGSAIGGLFGGSSAVAGTPGGAAIYARGGVFDRGAQIIPFASGGGIVRRPTMFPMRGGKVGLMGEAGPEAIMPLARDGSGRLGVRGGGSGGMTLNLSTTIDARGADKELRERLPVLLRQHREQIINDVRRLSDRGGSFSVAVGRRSRV